MFPSIKHPGGYFHSHLTSASRELLPVYQDVILPLADVAIPNQFEAELLTGLIFLYIHVLITDITLVMSFAPGQTITNEKEALAVMEMLHKKGVSTVILSRWMESTFQNCILCHSTELGSSDHLVGLASCSKTGTKVKVRNSRFNKIEGRGRGVYCSCVSQSYNPSYPAFAQVLIPKLPAAFVGTGDLFTALSTAWLARCLNLSIRSSC